jgi:hypothetical protein
MKRLFLFLAVFCAATTRVQAQSEPSPIVRAKFVPANHVIVGEPVHLQVDVLVPNFFTGAPDFPSFEMEGAIVTLSDDRPEHFNAQVNGTTYAGIRRFYSIYAERPGDLATPAVNISVPYATQPPDTTVAKLQLPQLHLSAALPAEARNLDYFLPTFHLTLTQKWSGPLNQLRTGDSVSRTVTIGAEKTKAMLIPPIALSAPDGVRIYPRSPAVDDEKSALGEFTQGVRTERATYLFTKPGDYLLPEITIAWWNLASKKLVTSRLLATKIHVLESAGYVSEIPPAAEPAVPVQQAGRDWRWYLPVIFVGVAVVAIVALLACIFWRWWPALACRYGLFVAGRRDSERGHWNRLKRALKQNDAQQSYALLLAWLRCTGLSLEAFRLRAAEHQLDRQIAILSETLFQQKEKMEWDGLALLTALSKHRPAAPTMKKSRHLPALNPH